MSRSLTGGSSHYLTTDGVSLSGTPFTLVGWVNAASWPGTTQTVVAVGDGVASYYSRIDTFNTSAYATGRAGGGSASSGGAGGLTTSTWHFTAARFSSNTSRQSQRGTTRGTVNSTSIAHTISRLRVGRRPDSSGDYFTGLIAHVALFNYAVSDADLDALAGGANPMGLATPPIHYWPLANDLDFTDIGSIGGATLTNVGSTWSSNNPTIAPPATSKPIAPAIVSASTVTIAPRRRRRVAPAVVSASAMTVAARRRRRVVAAIASASTVTIVARLRQTRIYPAIVSASTVTITPRRRRRVTVAIASASSMAATARRRRRVVVAIASASSLGITARKKPKQVAPAIVAASTVTFAPRRRRRLAVQVAAASAVTIVPKSTLVITPLNPVNAALIAGDDRRVTSSIRLLAEDGKWMEVGRGAGLGIVHQGLTMTANDRGPDSCSFTLRRDPTVPWPDLDPFNECVIETAGEEVWSGRIRETPGQSGSSEALGFMGSGWQHHTDDALTTLGFIHQRLGEWRDARETLGPAWSGGGLVVASRGFQVIGWANGTEVANNTAVGITVDLGEHHPRAVRISALLSAVAPHTFADVYIRGHSVPDAILAGALSGASHDYSAVSFSTITTDTANPNLLNGAASSPGWRYFSIFMYRRDGTSGAVAESLLNIHAVRVFAADAYEASGDTSLVASDVVKAALASGAVPLLDRSTSEIQTSSFTIPDLWPEKFTSPRDFIDSANAFHDWQVGVDVKRRLFFRERPDTAGLEVGPWSGAEFSDTSAGSAEDVYNMAIVEGTGGDGQALQVTRYAAEASPELARVVDVGGLANPGFDVNTTGWTAAGGTTLTRQTTGPTPYEGSGAGNLFTAAGDAVSVTTTLSNLTVGRIYTVTYARIRTTVSGTAGRVYAEVAASSGATLGRFEEDLFTAGSWKVRTVTFTATETTATLRIGAYRSGGAVPPPGIRIDAVRVRGVEVNVVDRHNFIRSARIPIGAGITPASGEQIADIWLRNHMFTPLKGDLAVVGQGGVREARGGGAVHPAHLLLRYGQRIRITTLIDPDTGALGREGTIASVTYSEDSGAAAVSIDNERNRFESFISRLAALTSQVG